MIGTRGLVNKKNKDDAEKPFWISFSDLMTALMALFMVVMVVALTRVAEQQNIEKTLISQREADIREFLSKLEQLKKAGFDGIEIDYVNRTVSFGEKARFESGSHKLSPESVRFIRGFTKSLLQIARDEDRQWLKRLVVEGFTDKQGSYLLNLDLSLKRSQRVLCSLLSEDTGSKVSFTQAELLQIRQQFLVGGYSSNAQKERLEESRRIEFRMEFKGYQPVADGEEVIAIPEEIDKPIDDSTVVGRCMI